MDQMTARMRSLGITLVSRYIQDLIREDVARGGSLIRSVQSYSYEQTPQRALKVAEEPASLPPKRRRHS